MWCIVTISCNLIITRFVLHRWPLDNWSPLLANYVEQSTWNNCMTCWWLWCGWSSLYPWNCLPVSFTVNSKYKWPSLIHTLKVYVFYPLETIKDRIMCVKKQCKRCSWYSALVSFYQRGRQWPHWLPCKLLRIKLRYLTSSDIKRI